MKAIKLLLAATLVAGLATFAFAGPSPLFTNLQEQNQPTKVQPAAQTACADCNCSCPAMKKS